MAGRPCRKTKRKLELELILIKEEERQKIKQIRSILKKNEWDLTSEESSVLAKNSHLVHQVRQRINKHKNLCERVKEVTDPSDILEEKCFILAEALKKASSVVVYTGAGISTAAKIPDYRGPEGLWTLLEKGRKVEVPDLSVAEPTFTHMAISQMHTKGIITHVVSQNCDGLHLRSGLPRKALSEVHGNMFIEVCPSCKPLKQYIRLFDVTENTGLHRHFTGRCCKKCGTELKDTIVHFGERGRLAWPLNWKGAGKAAANADLILCLGSSLKVLKRYPCLWASDKPAHKKPQLYIVNLQWTPKDSYCTLKINGKCDSVLRQLMSLLDIKIPSYEKDKDPIFQLATKLTSEEKETTSRQEISKNKVNYDLLDKPYTPVNCDVSNKISDIVKLEVEEKVTPILLESEFSSIVIKPEQDDSQMLKTIPNRKNDLSGWFGKGVRLKKYKKRKMI